jgi:hypothetical protein
MASKAPYQSTEGIESRLRSLTREESALNEKARSLIELNNASQAPLKCQRLGDDYVAYGATVTELIRALGVVSKHGVEVDSGTFVILQKLSQTIRELTEKEQKVIEVTKELDRTRSRNAIMEKYVVETAADMDYVIKKRDDQAQQLVDEIALELEKGGKPSLIARALQTILDHGGLSVLLAKCPTKRGTVIFYNSLDKLGVEVFKPLGEHETIYSKREFVDETTLGWIAVIETRLIQFSRAHYVCSRCGIPTPYEYEKPSIRETYPRIIAKFTTGLFGKCPTCATTCLHPDCGARIYPGESFEYCTTAHKDTHSNYLSNSNNSGGVICIKCRDSQKPLYESLSKEKYPIALIADFKRRDVFFNKDDCCNSCGRFSVKTREVKWSRSGSKYATTCYKCQSSDDDCGY